MVLEVTVTCPGEHRMALERVGATGGSWVCYLIKKKRGNWGFSKVVQKGKGKEIRGSVLLLRSTG